MDQIKDDFPFFTLSPAHGGHVQTTSILFPVERHGAEIEKMKKARTLLSLKKGRRFLHLFLIF